MAIDYTTTGLIASIKRRISLPDAQNLYSDDDLIGFMSEEMSSTIIPLIHSVQQEYWVTVQDIAMVQNKTNYTLPVRGITNGLRLATLVDNGGNEIDFPRIQPENVASTYNWLSPYSTATVSGFYFEDDHIVIFPQSVVTNPVSTVRFRYERSPNVLCATANAAQIISIAGNIVTVNNIPATWTTSLTFDITKGSPAFPSKGDDLTISAINTIAETITFVSLPSTTAIGDWIAEAGESPIPQIPVQMFPYLAQAGAVKCLEGMSDLEPWKAAKAVMGIMKEDLLKLLQPRDMGNVQTIVNRGGLFESSSGWGYGQGW